MADQRLSDSLKKKSTFAFTSTPAFCLFLESGFSLVHRRALKEHSERRFKPRFTGSAHSHSGLSPTQGGDGCDTTAL